MHTLINNYYNAFGMLNKVYPAFEKLPSGELPLSDNLISHTRITFGTNTPREAVSNVFKYFNEHGSTSSQITLTENRLSVSRKLSNTDVSVVFVFKREQTWKLDSIVNLDVVAGKLNAAENFYVAVQ